MGWAIPADTLLSPGTFKKRLPVAVAVLLLHVAFFAMLTLRQTKPIAPEREVILNLATITAAPRPRPAPKKIAPPAAPAPPQFYQLPKSLEGPLFKPYAFAFIRPFAPSNAAPGPSALASACSADPSLLSLEQRMRCRDRGFGFIIRPPTEIPFNQKSAAKNPERWQEEIDRRNQPLIMPGGVFMPLMALGALLGQDNAMRHPETWTTGKEMEDAKRRAIEDKKMNRGFTPKLPWQ